DPDERLERAGLTATPTFGNLREHSREWLTRLFRRCVTAGWVSFSGGDRPVVILTEEGPEGVKGGRPAALLPPAVTAARAQGAARPPSRRRARRSPRLVRPGGLRTPMSSTRADSVSSRRSARGGSAWRARPAWRLS